MTFENSPSNVPATDQPFIQLTSADAVVKRSVRRKRCAVHHERCTGQRLEGRAHRAVRVEVMRPCRAAAQRQHRAIKRVGFVGTQTELAARRSGRVRTSSSMRRCCCLLTARSAYAGSSNAVTPHGRVRRHARPPNHGFKKR